MNTPKYNLSNLTPEEQAKFMQEFEAFLTERSIFFEPVPQFTRDSLKDPWKIVTQVYLQKKELVVEEDIPSPIQAEDLK